MPISKAQQKAVHKYVKNNYDRVELSVKPKGKKEQMKAHAESKGETLNSFINRAIDETMERDNNEQGRVYQRPEGDYCAVVPVGNLDFNNKKMRKTKTKSGFKTEKEALDYIKTFKENASKEGGE